MEIVTYKQWDGQIRRIFNVNIKNHGKSLSPASMRGDEIIIEIRDGEKIMCVQDDWRKELKRRYLIPKTIFNYKEWLQGLVNPYGIDLNKWHVELTANPRPTNYPSHLPYSGQIVYATHPDNKNLEIEVRNVWVGKSGEVLQHDGIRLGA